MNKNVLTRIAALVLVAGVLLTSFGCKKNEGADDNNEPSSHLVQPTIENGTMKYEYPSMNEVGTEVMVTKVTEVNDFVNQLYAGKSLDKINKDRFISRYSSFGITKEQAEEMVKDGTTWKEFSVNIYIANVNSLGVSFRSITATNQENIKMDTMLDCEYGLPSGKGNYIAINGIVDSSKFETEEAILEALKGMDIQIVYTLLEDSAESVDDWSQVTTAYMPVKF